MGRHNKREPDADGGAADHAGYFDGPSPDDPRDRDQAPEGGPDQPRRRGLNLPMPMLPIVAAVAAAGVVTYAYSTKQISLNFGGGGGSHAPQAGAPLDSQVSQRNPGRRTSRGAPRADSERLTVRFQLVTKTARGFTGTATITNRGTAPVARWALAFQIPKAKVRSLSGGTVVKTGRTGWVRSPAGAPALAPGQSVKITFTAAGRAGGPSACRINKRSCTRG
ncbi:cellulose binding domain-containing protein [Actinomadura kijaniata]|uniref:cellulose binding domain-containing protein n=1 Tax=Actinomadura kijaniata TaxID=46161 RepID=UPI00082F9E9C|nr:cellulose binding domain-containing protein [Actinomadura kijaniata]